MSKRGISFSTTVEAGSSDVQEYDVSDPATIEQLSIRIYPGAETDLEIVPQVLKDQTNTAESLVRFQGKEYVDGDDDVFEWDLSVPVVEDDKIQIRAENKDANNPYDYRVNVEIDERNGIRAFWGI